MRWSAILLFALCACTGFDAGNTSRWRVPVDRNEADEEEVEESSEEAQSVAGGDAGTKDVATQPEAAATVDAAREGGLTDAGRD